ncbi:MAG: acyl-CoA dehydrogenase family protein, partial [Longimicrobiales bacterium]
MDFSWTEEQQRLRDEIVEFARTELAGDDLVERDHRGEFSREGWARCAERGLLGLSVPEEYGGHLTDLLTAVRIMEGLGYGCPDNGLALALNAQIWTVQLPIVRFGSHDQKERFLPGMCAGRLIGAHALTEPGAGSDALGSMRTTAKKDGDDYILNGTKIYITNGPIADLVLVYAKTSPEKGAKGISAF